jgi:hypothetical protein
MALRTHIVMQFAVRVKGTHKYLPRPQRRDGRGGSHYEPIDFSEDHNPMWMIRTFNTERAAKNLLQAWVKGKWYGDEDGDCWLKAQDHRDINLMEIVALQLHLPN